MEDSGTLTEKDKLPIMEITLKDTGEPNEYAYATVGPLRCFQGKTFTNILTCKIIFSAILQWHRWFSFTNVLFAYKINYPIELGYILAYN